MIRRWLLVSVMLLSACATSPPPELEEAFYSDGPEERMPPLSVYIVKPSEDLESACRRKQCLREAEFLEALYDELGRTGMFADVALRDEEQPWQLYMAARALNEESIASASGKILLSSASLLALPVDYKRSYHAEFILAWNGHKIARYTYSVPYKTSLSLLRKPDRGEQAVARSLVSKLIADMQGNEVFDAAELFRVLKASDYDADLRVPVTVAGFTHTSTTILPNPLAGVYLQFRNGYRSAERYELFVYPARRIDWTDSDAVLESAVDEALAEIESGVEDGVYLEVEFEPAAIVELPDGESGMRVSGRVVGAAGDEAIVALWLFVREDKLIKFRGQWRASDEPPAVPEWVQATMAEITVPPESPFMRKLREAESRRLSQ